LNITEVEETYWWSGAGDPWLPAFCSLLGCLYLLVPWWSAWWPSAGFSVGRCSADHNHHSARTSSLTCWGWKCSRASSANACVQGAWAGLLHGSCCRRCLPC